MAKRSNVKVGVNMAKKPSAQKVGEARVFVRPKLSSGDGGILTKQVIKIKTESKG